MNNFCWNINKTEKMEGRQGNHMQNKYNDKKNLFD